VDSTEEAVTPQAWKLGSQKSQPFQNPHSNSAGKYNLNTKFVNASSWPLSLTERSKNQPIERQVFLVQSSIQKYQCHYMEGLYPVTFSHQDWDDYDEELLVRPLS